MPVLIEIKKELFEKNKKIETLLFIAKNKQTKGKVTRSYQLDIREIRNVLFLTSEKNLSKLEKSKNCLFLSLENENDSLKKAKYILNNELVGAELDYILYFWKNNEQILQHFHKIIEEKYTFFNFEPAKALYLTFYIIESFYGKNFLKLKEKLDSLITEHEKNLK